MFAYRGLLKRNQYRSQTKATGHAIPSSSNAILTCSLPPRQAGGIVNLGKDVSREQRACHQASLGDSCKTAESHHEAVEAARMQDEAPTARSTMWTMRSCTISANLANFAIKTWWTTNITQSRTRRMAVGGSHERLRFIGHIHRPITDRMNIYRPSEHWTRSIMNAFAV